MKIKVLNYLFIIDILTILLILAVTFIPSSVARIILGLPFLLFFPGYTLVAALFPRKGNQFSSPSPSSSPIKGEGKAAKEGMDGLELIALSFGMSIAVTALIGLALNYTPWGIRLQPVMYSNAAFIILMSVVAWMRNKARKPTLELKLRLPGWEGSSLNKALTVILVISIVGAIGVLGYTVAKPKVGEKFTEFYILGNNGKAENYPTQFVMTQGRLTGVSYDGGKTLANSGLGKLTLGIVNHEQQKASYSVMIQIDGQQVDIDYAGQNLRQLDRIELQQGEKWEEEIGFAPQHSGDNQKVEFLLYKDGASSPENSLHLWINVSEKNQ